MSSRNVFSTFPLMGDPDLDRARVLCMKEKTSPETFWERVDLGWAFLMLLQRLDANLEAVLPWIARIESCPVEADLKEACIALDGAMRAMEKVFSVEQDPSVCHVATAVDGSVPASCLEEPRSGSDWPMYGGNASHSAWTKDPGPQQGKVHWTFHAGFAWYASPLIVDGNVYLACPGMREQMRCLDLHNGEEIWSTVRKRSGRPRPTSHVLPQSYTLPAVASTPVLSGSEEILVAELGAQGLENGARSLLRVDRKTGGLLGSRQIGFADYRMGTARLAGNDDFVVHPDGLQRIEASPPQCMGHHELVCRHIATGEEAWRFPLGLFFADPVMGEDRVIVGTSDGLVFCLSLTREAGQEGFGRSDTERVLWMFQASASTNSAVALAEGRVCFGDNHGTVYLLDAETGELKWRRQLEEPEERAFVHFSPPLISEGIVYLGSAGSVCVALDVNSGDVLWRHVLTDWQRARPVALEDGRIGVVTLDGTLLVFQKDGKIDFQLTLTSYPVFADPVVADGVMVVTDAGLHTYAVDLRFGKILWSCGLLRTVKLKGRDYRTDELGSGGFCQSKPTVLNGRVYIGSPSRFMNAVDAVSGERLWRYELSGAISGAPACLSGSSDYPNGLILIGQQGGGDEFVGLDAVDGSKVWEQNLGWVWSSATLSDSKAYIPCCDGHFVCLDGKNGHVVWRKRSARAAHPESPVDQGRVFFGSWDHFVYTLDAGSGRLLWKFFTGGSPDSGAPIAEGGRVMVPMGGKRLCCLNAEDGSLLWELRPERGCMNASPALRDGRLYISLSVLSGAVPPASEIRCHDAATGKPNWAHAGGGITGPSLAGNQLLAATTSGTHLISLDPASGERRWSVDLGDRVYESVPAISGSLAFILTESSILVAIR